MLGVDATLTLSAVGGSAEFAVVVLAYSPPLVAFPPLNKYKFLAEALIQGSGSHQIVMDPE